MKDKIFVYQRNLNGVLHLVEEFDSSSAFASHYNEEWVKRAFSNDDSERVMDSDCWGNYKSSILNAKVYAKVAYNSKDKLLPVSQLVGYCRNSGGILIINRGRYKGWDEYWMMIRRGRKPRAFGSFRYPRSTQEKRWANAWDDEEDCPPVRARRNIRHLPDAWDDHWSKTHKSWKKQSKRRHQWREK
jgi:hypothetical protein